MAETITRADEQRDEGAGGDDQHPRVPGASAGAGPPRRPLPGDRDEDQDETEVMPSR